MTPLNLGGALFQLTDTQLRLFVGFLISRYTKFPAAMFWHVAAKFIEQFKIKV